jgi:hypothetical protein
VVGHLLTLCFWRQEGQNLEKNRRKGGCAKKALQAGLPKTAGTALEGQSGPRILQREWALRRIQYGAGEGSSQPRRPWF